MKRIILLGLLVTFSTIPVHSAPTIVWGVEVGDVYNFQGDFAKELKIEDNSFSVRVTNTPASPDELNKSYLEITENSLTTYLKNFTSFLIIPLQIVENEKEVDYVAFVIGQILDLHNATVQFTSEGVMQLLYLYDAEGVIYFSLQLVTASVKTVGIEWGIVVLSILAIYEYRKKIGE